MTRFVRPHSKIEFIGDGGYTLASLLVHAHEEVVVTGDIVAQGDISITTSDVDNEGLTTGVDGLLFTADSAIMLSDGGARIQSNTGSVALLAEATLGIQTSDFSPGSVNIAFAVGIAGAQIDISGGTISAATTVGIEAKTTVTSTLSTLPDDASDDDDEVDAAVASAIIASTPAVTVSGGTITAGGAATVKATNAVTVTSTADGLTGDQGGTVAFNLVTGGTSVTVSGGSITGSSVTLQAASDRTSTATAVATVGGANSSGSDANESEKRLKDPNKDGSQSDHAKTDEGNMDFAAAVAVAVVTGDTTASITGGSVVAQGGNLNLKATGSLNVTTTLGGGSVDATGAINVQALVPQGGVEAKATSGAGGSNLGIAGSLALNVALLDARAVVSGTVAANGADLFVLADSRTDTRATAKAKVDGSGDPTGVGASVAINIGDSDTHAQLANSAVLTGADAFSLDAKSRHDMVTEAKGGATGGTAAADGEAAGSSAAVGAAIGFAYSHDDVVATTLRDVAAASGAVSFTASATGQNTTRAKASASGAEDTGSNAQQQGDSKRGTGNQRAASSGATGSGTDKQAEAETPGSSSGDGDSVAVAAAIAIGIVDGEARAEIGDGRSIVAGGVLTVRSQANIDGASQADGTAVDAGAAGVGAAVTVNTVDVDNTAKIGASSITADGIAVEALMAERKVTLQTITRPVVDTDAETIFLGMGHGLAAGQKVTYQNGGGTSVGGLTSGNDYYVRDLGHGKVALFDTEAHAKDGDSSTGRLDLTSAGAGDNHKLDLPFPAGALSVRAQSTSANIAKALPEGDGAVADSVGIGVLRVEVVLPQAALGRLKPRSTAVVTADGMGPQTAMVTIVDGLLDSASGTFGVRLQLPNADGKVPAGIRCRVDFPELRNLPSRASALSGAVYK